MGASNTSVIVAAQGVGNYAAKLCYDLVLNGYDDWFLPSSFELQKILINKNSIGGFSTSWYWSSTDDYVSSYKAMCCFSIGTGLLSVPKSELNSVRSIKYF